MLSNQINVLSYSVQQHKYNCIFVLILYIGRSEIGIHTMIPNENKFKVDTIIKQAIYIGLNKNPGSAPVCMLLSLSRPFRKSLFFENKHCLDKLNHRSLS